MTHEDLRKLREQIESGEALVRPESVIVEVIDRAIAAEAELVRLRKAIAEVHEEICQTLGKALGYPWFKDDQKNWPGADESWGVAVGDHVAQTLAEEAARKIAELREALEAFYFEESTYYTFPKDGTLLTPLGKMRRKDFELARKALGLKEKA